VRLLGNCLNCHIYLNFCSPIYRILPTDCNCCKRNDSKTKFVVYLTVKFSQIYWRKYCKSQKPPGWPLCDTRLKSWFPRVCSRDANFHYKKLGVIWDGMEITTVRETLWRSSQLSLVTIRRWIILWHHGFDRTCFLIFLSDLGLRVYDVSHLSWKCDSNTHNYYCRHCAQPKHFRSWFCFCHQAAYNRLSSVLPIRKSSLKHWTVTVCKWTDYAGTEDVRVNKHFPKLCAWKEQDDGMCYVCETLSSQH